MRPDRQQCGCIDTAPPENVSTYDLSRIIDIIDAFGAAGLEEEGREWFKTLPDVVKLEFNYANWRYQPAVRGRKCTVR